MKIFAIETSCDETAIAMVEANGGLKNPQFKVIQNIVSSQIAVHRPFGGVVPNLAKREHLKNLPKIFQTLTASSEGGSASLAASGAAVGGQAGGKRYTLNPDLIAVTVGPGLEPALWTGIEYAKQLSKELKKPLIGVNHMEGHLYSNWLPRNSAISVKRLRSKKLLNAKPSTLYATIEFPAIALVVSGGHTILLKMDSLTKWKNLGETLDDAAGEAFDKVARMLKLPYPGGPEIQKLAKKGDPKAIKFPRPMLKDGNYNFSFSGLKTSVLYYLRDNPLVASRQSLAADVAASFQQAVLDVLVGKTMRAVRAYRAKSVLLCGGVSANTALRADLQLKTNNLGLNFFVPDFEYNTDNAAMIAAAAYIQYLRKKKLRLSAQSNLSL